MSSGDPIADAKSALTEITETARLISADRDRQVDKLAKAESEIQELVGSIQYLNDQLQISTKEQLRLKEENEALQKAVLEERAACALIANEYQDGACCDGHCGSTIAEKIEARG